MEAMETTATTTTEKTIIIKAVIAETTKLAISSLMDL
jgi:hypothetical protein